MFWRGVEQFNQEFIKVVAPSEIESEKQSGPIASFPPDRFSTN
jgi:hypothetical protein